jgi:hypothetical protein
MLQRAVRDHLLRLPEHVDGVIFDDTVDPISELLVVLGVHRDELKQSKLILHALLDDGFLVHEGAVLRIANFEAGQCGWQEKPQKSAEAEKKARQRARKKAAQQDSQGDTAGTMSPGHNGDNAPDKSRLDQIREDQRREEKMPSPGTASPGAGASGAGAHSATTAQQHDAALRSRETAERLPIEVRCQTVLRRDDLAQWCQPQRGPEVAQAVRAFDASHGRTQSSRLGELKREAGLRALVGLFADGYTSEQGAEAARRSGSDKWFRSQKRGLAALTPEVVRRLLDDAPAPSEQRAVEYIDL